MADKRGSAALIFGMLLLTVGTLLLAENLGRFQISWVSLSGFGLSLFLSAAGFLKLLRHFSWTQEQLLKRPSKTSLLGGILWTTVGLLILLDLLDLLEGFVFFVDYWPIILILLGMGKIIDFYRLEGRPQFRMREVIGIVLVILLGLASEKAVEARLRLIDLDFPLIITEWETIKSAEILWR